MPAGKKLIATDMDGVLTKHPSSWSYLHKIFGVDNSAIYAKYRAGQLPYSEFLSADVSLWINKYNKLKKDYIVSLLERIPLMDNLFSGLELLRKSGFTIVVISGGISWLTEIISRSFKFDLVFSNEIGTDKENYIIPQGRVNVIPREKEKTLKKVQDTLGISPEDTISIGDSDFDARMFPLSGLNIASNPNHKEIISESDLIIYSEDFLFLANSILRNSQS